MEIKSPYHKENKIILKREGKMVAYILFRRVGRIKSRLYELIRIEVLPKYQRIGLATQLFNEMLENIKFRKLFVTTQQDNSVARLFYKKMGMKFETSLQNHYYKGKSEYIYSMFRKAKKITKKIR